MLSYLLYITLGLLNALKVQIYIYHEFIDFWVAIPVHMTSNLRLPILGLGRRCLICPSSMRFIINSYFLYSLRNTFMSCINPAWHPPHGHCYITVVQEHNNGKILYMETQAGHIIRCICVALHLTVNVFNIVLKPYRLKTLLSSLCMPLNYTQDQTWEKRQSRNPRWCKFFEGGVNVFKMLMEVVYMLWLKLK